MPRTLLFDIETTPLTSYTWGTYQTNVIKVKEEWSILSVAYKWLGEKRKPRFVPAEVDKLGVFDFRPVHFLWELFNEADIVVAHNATKFDVPKARARMEFHDLGPHSPVRVVDTLRIARSEFAFTSNRLDDLCEHLGLGRKQNTGGFGLWEGCMAGDERAWRTMERYNIHDVVLLERLYKRLRPWGKHPQVAERPRECPKCNSTKGLVVRGWRTNQVTKRAVFQCKGCGGYVFGRPLEKLNVNYVP